MLEVLTLHWNIGLKGTPRFKFFFFYAPGQLLLLIMSFFPNSAHKLHVNIYKTVLFALTKDTFCVACSCKKWITIFSVLEAWMIIFLFLLDHSRCLSWDVAILSLNLKYISIVISCFSFLLSLEMIPTWTHWSCIKVWLLDKSFWIQITLTVS